jgi:hypothetical protein
MAPYALAPYITGFLPGVLQAFLFITAKSYYTIVSYNLMGYVMLQYHETIGFHTVDYEDFRDQGAVMEDFREPSPPLAPPDPAKKAEEHKAVDGDDPHGDGGRIAPIDSFGQWNDKHVPVLDILTTHLARRSPFPLFGALSPAPRIPPEVRTNKALVGFPPAKRTARHGLESV